jgi:hypothetical protein
MNDGLRGELLRMIEEDDSVRARLAKDGSLFQGYHPEMEEVHRRNASRLREVLKSSGWPGLALVGQDGAEAAWRIVQHAISEPDFMRECLTRLQDAATRNEADPCWAAMLEDRIRVFEGRPQRYGTQYDWSEDGDSMVLTGGVEDPHGLDERRRAVGLGAIEWRRDPPPDEPRPRDVAARRMEAALWAERVGWRPSGR